VTVPRDTLPTKVPCASPNLLVFIAHDPNARSVRAGLEYASIQAGEREAIPEGCCMGLVVHLSVFEDDERTVTTSAAKGMPLTCTSTPVSIAADSIDRIVDDNRKPVRLR